MNDSQLIRFGNMLAAYTRVLGMQAENMQRSAVGSSMAYDADAFYNEASNIERYRVE